MVINYLQVICLVCGSERTVQLIRQGLAKRFHAAWMKAALSCTLLGLLLPFIFPSSVQNDSCVGCLYIELELQLER